MTVQVEDDRPPIWFFIPTANGLVDKLDGNDRVIASFASKGHDLFAAMHRRLVRNDDRAGIDRLSNRPVAAGHEGGKDHPKLAVLRFDTGRAEIRLNESSLLAGIKLLFGFDPKAGSRDKVAHVKPD